MNETIRTAFEAEAPVNPYSLLVSVNESSRIINRTWLIFLAVSIYILITVAGVTHKDLLLNNDIVLPILQVKIGLVRFFLFVPLVLLLFHIAILGQLVLLARSTIEFDRALQLLEATDRRAHPLRFELHNFFFIQAIAGLDRSRIIGAFLRSLSWLTLVILPIAILLCVQVDFLPYHSLAMTWWHRVAVLFDVVMLSVMGAFLVQSEISFFTALWRTVQQHPFSVALCAVSVVIVSMFSLCIATIPGEVLDNLVQVQPGKVETATAGQDSGNALERALLYIGASVEGVRSDLFDRNLRVMDSYLLIDKDAGSNEPSANLRGRDLRFARLDRSKLRQIDLTGADLEEASLIGTDLTGARMECADLNELRLKHNRRAAQCTSAKRADFSFAKLTDAKLSGIDLRGAKLKDARLEGAELTEGLMSGADFGGAHLGGADLTGGVALQGANFLLASLQGADLTGAQLQLADFSNAGMQGVILLQAKLEGAVFRGTDLEGADLQLSELQGVDFSGANMTAADLRGATVWQTVPPTGDKLRLADTSHIFVRPLNAAESGALADEIAKIDNRALRARLAEGVATILDGTNSQDWAGSPNKKRWQDLTAASESTADGFYKSITEYLDKLMCRVRWSNGSVATGIAKRARSEAFRGNSLAIYERLKGTDCPASKTIPRRVLEDLASRADDVRGQ
jgi:uncharacterized protein YjbI with pentapeptide repeats